MRPGPTARRPAGRGSACATLSPGGEPKKPATATMPRGQTCDGMTSSPKKCSQQRSKWKLHSHMRRIDASVYAGGETPVTENATKKKLQLAIWCTAMLAAVKRRSCARSTAASVPLMMASVATT